MEISVKKPRFTESHILTMLIQADAQADARQRHQRGDLGQALRDFRVSHRVGAEARQGQRVQQRSQCDREDRQGQRVALDQMRDPGGAEKRQVQIRIASL